MEADAPTVVDDDSDAAFGPYECHWSYAETIVASRASIFTRIRPINAMFRTGTVSWKSCRLNVTWSLLANGVAAPSPGRSAISATT